MTTMPVAPDVSAATVSAPVSRAKPARLLRPGVRCYADDVLTLPAAPEGFRIRVVWPYDKIGQLKVNFYGADAYITYTELVRMGATFLHPEHGR